MSAGFWVAGLFRSLQITKLACWIGMHFRSGQIWPKWTTHIPILFVTQLEGFSQTEEVKKTSQVWSKSYLHSWLSMLDSLKLYKYINIRPKLEVFTLKRGVENKREFMSGSELSIMRWRNKTKSTSIGKMFLVESIEEEGNKSIKDPIIMHIAKRW